MDAALHGLIIPVLIGPEARLRSVAEAAGIDLNGIELLPVEHSHAAARKAVELAALGDVGMLMKGSLHTDELMHAVLSSPPCARGGACPMCSGSTSRCIPSRCSSPMPP